MKEKLLAKLNFIKYSWAKNNTNKAVIILSTVSTLIAGWALLVLIIGHFHSWNERGDFIAGVASFLAFAWLVAALFMQRRELQLQRDTLDNQIAELSLTKETLQQQTSTLRKQQFESTFFSMLDMLVTIRASIMYEKKNSSGDTIEQFTAVDALKNMFEREIIMPLFHGLFTSQYIREPDNDRKVEKHIENIYHKFWGAPNGFNGHSKLAHYFRYLHAFLIFIDDQPLIENKHLYFNLIRAQLSDYELAFILLNCLYLDGKGLRDLVKEHNLLKSFNKSVLTIRQSELHINRQGKTDKFIPVLQFINQKLDQL